MTTSFEPSNQQLSQAPCANSSLRRGGEQILSLSQSHSYLPFELREEALVAVPEPNKVPFPPGCPVLYCDSDKQGFVVLGMVLKVVVHPRNVLKNLCLVVVLSDTSQRIYIEESVLQYGPDCPVWISPQNEAGVVLESYHSFRNKSKPAKYSIMNEAGTAARHGLKLECLKFRPTQESKDLYARMVEIAGQWDEHLEAAASGPVGASSIAKQKGPLSGKKRAREEDGHDSDPPVPSGRKTVTGNIGIPPWSGDLIRLSSMIGRELTSWQKEFNCVVRLRRESNGNLSVDFDSSKRASKQVHAMILSRCVGLVEDEALRGRLNFEAACERQQSGSSLTRSTPLWGRSIRNVDSVVSLYAFRFREEESAILRDKAASKELVGVLDSIRETNGCFVVTRGIGDGEDTSTIYVEARKQDAIGNAIKRLKRRLTDVLDPN